MKYNLLKLLLKNEEYSDISVTFDILVIFHMK